uniref:Si:ch211-243a20.3 n=1 Tax=Gouania willdenowi TaxID=441366 RepID=A0A8C5HB83_GOUWI
MGYVDCFWLFHFFDVFSHFSNRLDTKASALLSWFFLSGPAMAPLALLMILTVVASATGAHAASEDNALDYGYWNYREGADRVNVATVRSVTRVLDAWGKRIFSEIKSLLHSQPSTLLPDYSRVRPLSESLNDLFREVSLLHRRITELTHRLATLDPFLRRYGYKDEEEAGGGGQGSTLRLEGATVAQPSPVRGGPSRGSRVVRRRRVRVYKNGEKRLLMGKT